MDNPLFGASAFPSPDGNPLFSARGASSRPPSTAKGMRRMSDLNPWDLPDHSQQAQRGDQPPTNALAVSPLPSTAAAVPPPRQRPEEQEFADILTRCMRGELDTSDALLAYADACRLRAADLRDVATSHLQRAPRYMALNAAADELDAEAATWSLMWHLHGVSGKEFPAGVGGEFVEGAGFAKTFRHHAADLLFQDDELNR